MSYNKLKAWNFTFSIYTIITIGILFPDISLEVNIVLFTICTIFILSFYLPKSEVDPW